MSAPFGTSPFGTSPFEAFGALALLPRGTPTTLSTLVARGRAAAETAGFIWVLIAISAVVAVIVFGVLYVALVRNAGKGDLTTASAAEAVREQHDHPAELRGVLVLGLALPTLILAAVFVWSSVQTDAQAQPFAVNDPDAGARADVLVIGHQWWWEVRYPTAGVVTANELHVPVGARVRIALRTDDVNHSFWVPQLAGKTDLVAGQTNSIWIEADTAGTYYGECGEFCGQQHAHMGLALVADSPAGYARWLAEQRGVAAGPPDSLARAGYATFAALGCAKCHAVRGTPYGGQAGPDLTHLASRVTLAAGTMPNTRADLASWVADPQRAKPGNRMPPVPMTGPELQAVVAYLESLR